MGDEEHRLVELLLQAHQLVLHAGTDQRIEGGKRLIHQQDVGIDRQRPGEADALLLATRELARPGILVAGEAHRFDPLPGTIQPLILGHALDLEAIGDVFDDGAMRQQAKLLEYHRHLLAAEGAGSGRLIDRTSVPPTMISPAVGSIRRFGGGSGSTCRSRTGMTT